MILELKNINKYYGNNHVVKNLDLSVADGEFLTILGPSGCGKTTTLRMIGGFELPNSGSISLRGNDITSLPPYKRNVNTVFQNYALFPNMTVAQNIAFGLEQKKKTRDQIKQKVGEALEMVRMESFGERKPQELSGGQQQRIAIARAVANDPDILLLDEPLGALDLKLRKQMQIELKTLNRELKKTFVYVTHDQEEALVMSDRIAVMNAGVLEQLSDANDLYYRPRTKFVADFIGEANIIKGNIQNQYIDCQGFNIPYGKNNAFAEGQSVELFVRPETLALSAEPKGIFNIEGRVIELLFVGSFRKYRIVLPNHQEIISHETTLSKSIFSPGEKVFIHWDIEKTSIF